MAYNESLASRIRAVLVESAGITEKRMFGGLAFLKHGHMFVGVTADELMARVGKDAYVASLARKHVHEMDFTGKPMVGYVFVRSSAGLAKESELAFWVRLCEQYASTLPPKSKKPVVQPSRRKSAA